MSKEAINAALDKKAENARELGLDYEPAQRTWVGLTDEESLEVMRQVPQLTVEGLLSVEAKLKEKNT